MYHDVTVTCVRVCLYMLCARVACSALDAESERVVQKALDNVVQGE